MTRHEHRIRHTAGHAIWRVLAAITAVTAAMAGGLATSTALADEPAKCNTSADKVCYAGYNANGLKTIANDLSVNGKSSKYYAKMHDNLTNDVKGTITLKDGSSLPFRLIGILHDDRADGSSLKAGLTFMATNALPKAYCMNGSMPSDNTTSCTGGTTYWGGWRDSRLREWMNSGEIWQSMPTDLQDNVTGVLKRTNNMKYNYDEYGDTAGAVSSATSDRLWIVSNRELASNQSDDWLVQYNGSSALVDEGSTYEWFSSKDVKDYQDNTALKDMYFTASGVRPAGLDGLDCWWERSPSPRSTWAQDNFLNVYRSGRCSSYDTATARMAVVPAFSF